MTYAVNPAYGIGFPKDGYLLIPVLGDILAVIVIPFVGDLSDKIGRRPLIVVAAIGSGLLSFPYLYAISIKNIPLAIANSLLMWGVVWVSFAPDGRQPFLTLPPRSQLAESDGAPLPALRGRDVAR